MMQSGFMAARLRAVSIRVSPLAVLLPELEMLKVSALIRLAATSKERRVLVLGSKKRLMTVLPRRVGTFLMARWEISLKEEAVCNTRWISAGERSARLRTCLCGKGCSEIGRASC